MSSCSHLLGVLKVNPNSIRRKRKDPPVDSVGISNDTISAAANYTMDSMSHSIGPNSTESNMGTEARDMEDEEAVAETAPLAAEEYDSLLRDLNAREKV